MFFIIKTSKFATKSKNYSQEGTNHLAIFGVWKTGKKGIESKAREIVHVRTNERTILSPSRHKENYLTKIFINFLKSIKNEKLYY